MASKQELLRAQIAALQKQIAVEDANEELKRKANDGVLVAASPSPTKKRKIAYEKHQSTNAGRPRLSAPSFGNASNSASSSKPKPKPKPQDDFYIAPKPSGIANALTSFNSKSTPAALEFDGSHPGDDTKSNGGRNDDLTICEDLQLGPYTFTPPSGDPLFKTVEPHSYINLKSRTMPHEDVEEFMRGRYYVSPSMLYSIARQSSSRSGYEVPLVGDWVTIAVIGERGEISVSKGASGDDDEHSDSEDDSSKKKTVEQSLAELASIPEPPAPGAPPKRNQPFRKKKPAESASSGTRKGPKKYVTLRLVDFGNRAPDLHTGKSTIRGDALLNMILFEAESWTVDHTDDGREQRVYKGGSGGAFEACANLRAGCVVGIMNPRILKPYQRGVGQPHPTDNILGLTPENAKSIIVIGQSKDLGHCPAIKRDGKPCRAWCDKRIHEACEFHVTKAIQSRKNSRPEFNSSQSGMSSTSRTPTNHGARGGKGASSAKDFDPSRKWGLLPKAGAQPGINSGGGTTYVLPGSGIVARTGPSTSTSGSSKASAPLTAAEEKRKRKSTALEDAKTMSVLRARAGFDGEGGEAPLNGFGGGGMLGMGLGALGGSGSAAHAAKTVVMARQALQEAEAREALKGKSKGKGKGKEVAKGSAAAALDKRLAEEKASTRPEGPRIFSASAIKKIGFDPRARPGEKHPDSKRINEVLASLQSDKKTFHLGHDPSLRSRMAPMSLSKSTSPRPTPSITAAPTTAPASQPDDSDDDLEITR